MSFVAVIVAAIILVVLFAKGYQPIATDEEHEAAMQVAAGIILVLLGFAVYGFTTHGITYATATFDVAAALWIIVFLMRKAR